MNLDNFYKCLNNTSLQLNIWYLIAVATILFLYNKNKIVGLGVSGFAILVLCFVPYTVGYLPLTMIKLMMIAFGSYLFFTGILFDCFKIYFNFVLTTIVRLNIFVLIITTHHLWLILSLIFVTITTPIFLIKDDNVVMSDMFIPKDLWVILATIILSLYYAFTPYFCSNIFLVISACIIPVFMHFVSNQYLESRALCLCIVFMFDILNNTRKSIHDFIIDSKY